MRLADLSGQRFEMVRVVDRAPNKSEKDTNARWNCVCDCGSKFVSYGQDLRRGKTKSCGCLTRKSFGARTRKINSTHGLTNTLPYKIWAGMHRRCKHKESYADVKVCERWSKFEAFLQDMGVPPEGRTLDRIDPFGDYSPENCRWATPKEQANNRRKPSVKFTHRGMTLTLVDWAKVLDIPYFTLYTRMKRGGSTEEILRPKRKSPN